jgi:hypothetical protein
MAGIRESAVDANEVPLTSFKVLGMAMVHTKLTAEHLLEI